MFTLFNKTLCSSGDWRLCSHEIGLVFVSDLQHNKADKTKSDYAAILANKSYDFCFVREYRVMRKSVLDGMVLI
jgi:hypothetical protein